MLAILLVAAIAATASAQTTEPPSVSALLDQQLSHAIGPNQPHNITGRMIVLALAELQAQARVRAAVNRLRTDIQMGATSNSPNTTSIMEKPGIADLLSLALDRGAITKTASGTGLTLSTTPYAIWTGFGATDTPQRWKNARLTRDISLSATFSSTDVTAGDFSSFTSGEVKWVIFGNRSPRDSTLLGVLRPDLGQIFLASDEAMDKACPFLDLAAIDTARGNMNNWLRQNLGATLEQTRAEFDKQLADVNAKVTPEELRPCVDAVLEGEKSIQGGLDSVTKATQAYLADQRPQLSVAALFVRDATLSDYYVGKLLFGRGFQQVTVNANAEASWNKESATLAGTPLRRLRAYSVELGLNTKTMAKGRIDGSVSAKGTRDEATNAEDLVIGEAKLNLHLTDTLRLPVTLSYANRETQTVKQGWQLNVGVSALLDETLRR
jgi:hypothetical protein